MTFERLGQVLSSIIGTGLKFLKNDLELGFHLEAYRRRAFVSQSSPGHVELSSTCPWTFRPSSISLTMIH